MSDHDEQDEAPETFDQAHARIKEAVYGSPLGLAEFLESDATTDRPEVIAALLQFINRRPASPEQLRDLLDDRIEQYAQTKAGDEQFNRPVYKPSFAPIDAQKMAALAFGIPQQPKDYEEQESVK